jgi:hypothetical protein
MKLLTGPQESQGESVVEYLKALFALEFKAIKWLSFTMLAGFMVFLVVVVGGGFIIVFLLQHF